MVQDFAKSTDNVLFILLREARRNCQQNAPGEEVVSNWALTFAVS
jgi:hypothetical protein